jgi:hypothetical protein
MKRKKRVAPEEREACILMNDAGGAMVWTNSPEWLYRLWQALGPPDTYQNGLARWENANREALLSGALLEPTAADWTQEELAVYLSMQKVVGLK